MTYHSAPTPLQTITVRGRLVYTGGPWGSNRPVNKFVNVNYVLYEPGQPKGSAFSGEGAQVGTTTLDSDGSFTVTAEASGVPQNGQTVEDVLELQEYNTNEWEMVPLDGVVWGRPGVQDVGLLRVGWDPPSKTLARVDEIKFSDTRGLALHLINLINRAPLKPQAGLSTRIRLQWEPGPGQEYTPAQESFKAIPRLKARHGYPASLLSAMNKVPGLRQSSKNPVDAFVGMLKAMTVRDIKMIEKDDQLKRMIEAIGEAQGRRSVSGVIQEAPDAAAVCVMLYCAARIAKDRAKVTTHFDSWKTRHAPRPEYNREYKTVDVHVFR